MPDNPYQGQLDAINQNTANQQAAFVVFMDKVVTHLRSLGYTVKMRIDTGGDGVFTTNATAQVDVTKDGVTARAAYTNFHTAQSPTTAARVATTAWLSAKNSTALGFAPTVEGNPLVRDPIKTQTAFNLNVEVPFATTKLGAPAVSLPPTNQPGQKNTTVPPGSDPGGSSGSSPNNNANDNVSSPPNAPINVIDPGGSGSGGSGSGVNGSSVAPTSGMIVGIIALAILFLIFRGR